MTLTWPDGVAETEESRDAFNEDATNKILAFADELRTQGKRPWFEIWYTGMPGVESTEADFDAVEVNEEGGIHTLPPYAELLKEV